MENYGWSIELNPGYVLIISFKEEKCMKRWEDFMEDESGMGVVEIILIMVVLIAMCVIFKQQITSLVNNIWNSINKSAKKIY